MRELRSVVGAGVPFAGVPVRLVGVPVTWTSPLPGSVASTRSEDSVISTVFCVSPCFGAGEDCGGRPSDGMCHECNEGS